MTAAAALRGEYPPDALDQWLKWKPRYQLSSVTADQRHYGGKAIGMAGGEEVHRRLDHDM